MTSEHNARLDHPDLLDGARLSAAQLVGDLTVDVVATNVIGPTPASAS